MSGQKQTGIPWPTVAITVLKDYGETAQVPFVAVRLEAHVPVPNDGRKIWETIDTTLARHPKTGDEPLRDIYHLLVPHTAKNPTSGDLRGLAMLQAGLGLLSPKRDLTDAKRKDFGPVSSRGGWPIMDRITGTDGSTRMKFDPADRRFFRIHMDVQIRADKVGEVEDAIASGNGDKACDAILENRVAAAVNPYATALVEAAFGVLGPIQPAGDKKLAAGSAGAGSHSAATTRRG